MTQKDSLLFDGTALDTADDHDEQDDTTASAKIPPNLRALAILETVSRAGVPVSPSEVQQALGLPKPTVHRLLQVMESSGYLQRDIEGRNYSPTERSRRLAIDVISSTRARAERLTILRKLSETVGETCNIAIPDRNHMVYLDRYETSWPLRIQLPIGTRVPLHCTATGKLYLSSLRASQRRVMVRNVELERFAPNTIQSASVLEKEVEQTKKRGYSVDNEEFVEGMVAVAVPVYGPNRRFFCSLSFHAPVQRLSLEKALAFVPSLKEAAKELAELVNT